MFMLSLQNIDKISLVTCHVLVIHVSIPVNATPSPVSC